MKRKKIAFILFTLFTIVTYSQTDKGKFIIGANSNLNFFSNSGKIKGQNNSFERDLGKTTQFEISPEIGYALLDDLFIGINFTYKYLDEDIKNYGLLSTTHSYLPSVFLKYYLSKKKLKPFLKTQYGYGVEKSEFQFTGISNGINYSKSKIKNFQIGAGLGYFINNIFNIEMNILYSNTSTNETGTLASDPNANIIFNSFETNIGFFIFL